MTAEKTKTISFRATERELKQIEEAVEYLGYESVSDLCRSLILPALTVSQLSPQLQIILGAVQSLSASVRQYYIGSNPDNEKDIAAMFDSFELQADALASRFLKRQQGKKKGTK